MPVAPHMLNGHGSCHGGFIFALADSAFAFACNSRGRARWRRAAAITYLRPVRAGERLVATARELALAGRSGLYDVQVSTDGRRGGRVPRPVPRHRGRRRCRARGVTGLDPIEQASRDELAALQTARLAATAAPGLRRRAALPPRVRRRRGAPGRLPQLADLARFPFTVKADLRDNYPFGLFAVPREQVARIHASSGTTGKPVVVGYTAADLAMWAGVVARSLYAAGARPGMTLHNAYGYGLFTGGLGIHAGAERLGCTVVPVGGGMTERQVQLITDFRPEVITVTPSYMLALLDEFARQGLDPRASSLKIGIFGAEPWTNAMRAEIEARVRHRRGGHLRPVGGGRPGRGAGMRRDQGRAAHLGGPFLPRGDRPADRRRAARRARSGELVFTTLTRQAAPVVRYRTRDLTRLLPGTARPAFRRMEKVTGRSDDMIILRGVNVFPTQIEEVLLATDWCAGHFQIELLRQGRMDAWWCTPRRGRPPGTAPGCWTRRPWPRRRSRARSGSRPGSSSSRRARWSARWAR